ncbi:hypothetical protein JOQ06_002022 [Pogonophryne albipinna]|uniref:Reverse transcriptase n=1 Tax=Pogonophryne albipinna TaxID=1090488 RepID=A0AAD6F533_9TELE|nr:hypothetical protein JOQ06_002022 [Pogonophryne albipinna]
MARSLRALEREVVELQGLEDSTGEREHVEGFKKWSEEADALDPMLGSCFRSPPPQCAVEFYKELYRTEFQAEPEVAQSFYEGLPNVPEEDHAELEAELSAQELQEALQSMQNGKAPGIDGLPADFYKALWPVIGDDLLSVLRDSLSNGRLPLICRRAVITLLPKKGDLQEIKSWRPVSLLCTDDKLLSKVLATRLRKVMEHVVHVDQTYCVPSRLITAG